MDLNLLVLMYHQIYDGSNKSLELFEEHIKYLTENFLIVLPNDKLSSDKLNVCLTFDDAYCDFYYKIYPLLKKHQLKAILGVSAKYIMGDCNISADKRLSVAYPQGMSEPMFKQEVPFCTWKELKEMAHSNFVQIACHSYSHPHLAHNNINLHQEIIEAKQIIQNNIDSDVNYFIYPYGNCNRKVHNLVRSNYQFGFRIGSALNKDWDHKRNMLYRIDADQYWKNSLPIPQKHLNKYNRKYWLNRLRIK